MPPRFIQSSIGAGENDHMPRLFAAADARFRAFALGVDAGGRRRLLLDLVLAGAVAAPAGFDEVALFHPFQKGGHIVGIDDAPVAAGARRFQHVLLHGFEEGGDRLRGGVERSGDLFQRVAAEEHDLALREVAGTHFDAHGHPLHFPFVELPAGGIFRIVGLHAHARLFEFFFEGGAGLADAPFLCRDGHDDGLHGRHLGREHQPALVAVRHDDGADEAGGHPPARGIGVFQRAVPVEEFDVERLGEVLPHIMGRARLQALAVLHHGFHAVGRHGARKLFLFGLSARDDGNGEAIFGKRFIDPEHLLRFRLRLFGSGVDGVPLLPQKLARAQEGTGGLFPAHNVTPLIDEQGQVAVGLHPLGTHVADDGFAGGADDERLGEFFPARVRDDRHFGREPLDVLRLFGEKTHGNEQGEVGVLHALRLEHFVELFLDQFPDGIAVRADDHGALDGAVVDQAGL